MREEPTSSLTLVIDLQAQVTALREELAAERAGREPTWDDEAEVTIARLKRQVRELRAELERRAPRP